MEDHPGLGRPPTHKSTADKFRISEDRNETGQLVYSDVIAAARTLIAVEGNATALQSRLPDGWDLVPYAGDDLRGTALKGANLLIPFHEVYAVKTRDEQHTGLLQVSYIAFVSQARSKATGELVHIHWLTYTEDPAGVPEKYKDGELAQIKRSQIFTKDRKGETRVREIFSAESRKGGVHLELSYEQGGMVVWTTTDKPNLPLRAANDPSIVRWYQEDQVLNIVRSEPMKIDRVSEITLRAQGELQDVLDGNERIIAVVIQRPYMRRVFVAE